MESKCVSVSSRGMTPQKIFLVLIFLIRPVLSVYSQDGWELAKDSEGIQIFTRRVEGSDFKEFRCTTTMDAALTALVAVYQDVDAYAEWMPNTSEVRMLEVQGDTAHVHYLVNPAPWPVADRDAVYRFRYSQASSSKMVTIEMDGLPDLIPEESGRVRIPRAGGFYRFTPMGDGRVRVVFQLQVEPGGNIPAWLVNWRIVDGPFKTLKRLRERVKLEKYQGRTFSFLME